MIEVSLDVAVKTQAKLARPIYGMSGQIMLQEGMVLTPAYAKKLYSLGILSVYIMGGKVQPEPLICEEVRVRANQVLKTFTQTQAPTVNLYGIIEKILNDVLAMKGIVDSIANISTYDGYTFTHSVDVSILAMSIATQMGFGYSTLLEIGMGALLHDIGKLKISPSIINKPGKLDDTEFAEIKKHSQIGYELVKSHPQVSDRAALMILEHHERYDGSGYPHGKKGKEIHLFSAICGVADVYNAMTTNRSYRKAYPPHEVYEMILGLGNTHFDFRAVEAFAKCIMPYPQGMVVRTSNNRIAQVMHNKTGHPYLPCVIYLDDDNNEEVDLYETGLTILGPVPVDEIEKLFACRELPIAIDRGLLYTAVS